MNTIKTFPVKIIFSTFLAIATILWFSSCSNADNDSTETESTNIVEVRALHDHAENRHVFEMSSHEVSSGWTTFEFTNASPVDHFFVIYHAPNEAVEAANNAGEPLLDHWFKSITEPFQLEFNPYVNGDIDYGEFVDNLVAAIGEKGPWFFDPGAAPNGGPGFTAPGSTSKTTVFLEPGEYIVECYVKDEDEQFHSYLGMLEHLTVSAGQTETEIPQSTISMSISSTNGIQAAETLEPGNHVIEILFEDQETYGHLLGHNVQLVKLHDNSSQDLLNELAVWMDWTQPGALVDRAPEGAEFIGGAMEMTEGATAYFHVSLEPGSYAWIAEIPNPAEHGMLKVFEVDN